MSAQDLQPVIAAVAERGLRPRLTSAGLDLVGDLHVGQVAVPVEIRFDDLSLAAAPRFILRDTSMLGRKVVPHVDETGDFCVVDRRAYVFDRFKAPEQVLGLVTRAAEVLERGMTKAGTDEIADELPSYWSASVMDLPASSAAGTKGAPDYNVAHVSTHVRLSFKATQARPATLGDLLDWAAAWDGRLRDRLEASLARLTAADPTLVIHAPNGTLVAQVRISSRGSVFMETLRRPGSLARFVKSAAGRALPIERHQGRSLDVAMLLGANGPGGRAPLAGRKIVLIGCGAIGGYLARALAQMGAGVDAWFALIDPDRLERPNTRRHQLGVGDLDRSKAEACAEAIGRDFPGLNLRPLAASAQSHADLLASADLMIDATGEQEFSDWLNAWAVDRRASTLPCPAVLFTWIAGFGWATQSFLMIDDRHACNRCLQPDLAQPARFDPLKDVVPEPVTGCGEQPITPYGPAASMAAASLAATHAVDWALGRPHHLLRTVRLDWEKTVKRDPKSPDRSPKCPACGAG